MTWPKAIAAGATNWFQPLRKQASAHFVPRGAYYVMTDISAFGFSDDVTFCKYLVSEIGVAAVPGSSFYNDPKNGAKQVRFAFCKKDATLEEAAKRLGKLAIR